MAKIGFPDCNGIKQMSISYSDWEGKYLYYERVPGVMPIGECFQLINAERGTMYDGPKMYAVFSAKVTIDGENIKLTIWQNAATGQTIDNGKDVERKADCSDSNPIVQEEEIFWPHGSGQAPKAPGQRHIQQSLDYSYRSAFADHFDHNFNLITVTITGNGQYRFDKETNCQFARWDCGKMSFMGTCVKSLKRPGWWTRLECTSTDSEVIGINHLTESMCHEDPTTSRTAMQRSTEDFTTFGTCALETCNPAEVAVPGANFVAEDETTTTRHERTPSQMGCNADFESFCQEYLTILTPVAGQGRNDAQRMMEWVDILDQDQCRYWFEKVFGTSMGFGNKNKIWEDDSGSHSKYATWFAGCLNVNRQAGTSGVIVRWWIEAESQWDLDVGKEKMEEPPGIAVGQSKTILTGFEADDPFPEDRFEIQMESDILVVKYTICGFRQTDDYRFLSAQFKGANTAGIDAAYELWQKVNGTNANQCEFWMREIMQMRMGRISNEAQACIGCSSVTGGADSGARVEWWISGSTEDVGIAVTQQSKMLSDKEEFTTTLEGSSFSLAMESSSETGSKTSLCGENAPHYAEITFTMGGSAGQLFDEFSKLNPDDFGGVVAPDQCVLWVQQTLGGWDENNRVCTGCIDVKKGSVIVRTWVSSDDLSAVESYVTEKKALKGMSIFMRGLPDALTFDDVTASTDGSTSGGSTSGDSTSGGSTSGDPVQPTSNPTNVGNGGIPTESDDSILGMGTGADVGIFLLIGAVVVTLVAVVMWLVCRSGQQAQPPQRAPQQGSVAQPAEADARPVAEPEKYKDFDNMKLNEFQV